MWPGRSLPLFRVEQETSLLLAPAAATGRAVRGAGLPQGKA